MRPGLVAAATDTGRDPAGDRIDPRIWRSAAVVVIGPFMTQLDSTVVNVSLSVIRQDLHATIAAAQWIVSGYLLTLALMLPLSGWLVDRVGQAALPRMLLGVHASVATVRCGADDRRANPGPSAAGDGRRGARADDADPEQRQRNVTPTANRASVTRS